MLRKSSIWTWHLRRNTLQKGRFPRQLEQYQEGSRYLVCVCVCVCVLVCVCTCLFRRLIGLWIFDIKSNMCWRCIGFTSLRYTSMQIVLPFAIKNYLDRKQILWFKLRMRFTKPIISERRVREWERIWVFWFKRVWVIVYMREYELYVKSSTQWLVSYGYLVRDI